MLNIYSMRIYYDTEGHILALLSFEKNVKNFDKGLTAIYLHILLYCIYSFFVHSFFNNSFISMQYMY
jgi:hypothetical protein